METKFLESTRGMARLFGQYPVTIEATVARVDVAPAMSLDGVNYYDEAAQSKVLAELKAQGLFTGKAE